MPSRKAESNRIILILLSAALVAACSSAPTGNAAAGGSDPNNQGKRGDQGKPDDQGNPDDQGKPDDQKKPGNCISDRVKPPSDANCACEWDGCDAKSMSCICGLSCYGDADKKCIISVNPGDGQASSSDGTINGCKLACSPESDLSTKITCSASSCEVAPNVNINIAPDIQTAPVSVEFDAQRQVAGVDVIFMIDNSSSMQNNQMASACAMNSFFQAAGQNGAQYQTGVLTTDLLCDTLACTTPVYSLTGQYQNAPALVSLAGTCTSTVSCNASSCESNGQSAVCKFGESGQMVSSDDPKSQDALRQLVVQGDKGSHREGGLEKAFQYFADQERKKTFDPNTPKEIVVISDEQADADAFLCPFKVVDRKTSDIPSFTPPTPANTLASCQQDLIDFYSYYFKSRNIIVHGLLFDDKCSNGGAEESGTIYEAVIKATGGHQDSICACDKFKDFFNDVGKSTSTLSTELCFKDALPDPSTIEVSYVENGAQTVVPPSAQDGWTLDQNLKCLVMNGSWKDKYGKFHIVYTDPNAKQVPVGEPKACLTASNIDPIAGTIQVSCGGRDVPQSSTDGYTYDPADRCFTFHGSNWATVVGSSCSVKYI